MQKERENNNHEEGKKEIGAKNGECALERQKRISVDK